MKSRKFGINDWLIVISVAVLLTLILYLAIVTEWYGLPDGPGEFGDQFGGATALFSGLAFAGLIVTLLLQRQELALQRAELSMTRGELAATRDEYSLQRFETTLFGLIKQWNDHIGSMERSWTREIRGSVVQDVIRGREYIRDIVGDFPDEFYKERQVIEFFESPPPKELRRDLTTQLEKYREIFLDDLEPNFAPYMRLLYGIFRHIEMSRINEDQKKMYSRIVRAHLSSGELKFLLFDCASGVGADFQPWITKYGLLKHLPEKVRSANPSLVQIYSNDAFEPVPIPHVQT